MKIFSLGVPFSLEIDLLRRFQEMHLFVPQSDIFISTKAFPVIGVCLPAFFVYIINLQFVKRAHTFKPLEII